MFPIRDHNPSGQTPYVTYALMALNILVFLSYYGIMNDARTLNTFWVSWAMIPVRVTELEALHTLITSMFLHGGILHLAGNMLFLFIFGDNVEDAFGHIKYLALYLASGVLAALSQVVVEPSSMIPTVGASGAIAGVMGAYLLLFPKARVDLLIIIVVIFKVIPVPAWIMLALWFVLQFIGGIASDPNAGGVAYWAHAGGFVAGLLLTIPLWLKRGGTQFWQQTHGKPPHPEASYRFQESRIPKVKRR